jgi:hypothetical protein
VGFGPSLPLIGREALSWRSSSNEKPSRGDRSTNEQRIQMYDQISDSVVKFPPSPGVKATVTVG